MAEKFEVSAVGRVTRDPELKHLPNGTALAEFGLATTKDYKKNDEWVKNTLFSNWQAWGERANLVMERLHKGDKVELVGEYSTRSWEDKKTGEKRTASEFKFTKFAGEENIQVSQPVSVPSVMDDIDTDIPF